MSLDRKGLFALAKESRLSVSFNTKTNDLREMLRDWLS